MPLIKQELDLENHIVKLHARIHFYIDQAHSIPTKACELRGCKFLKYYCDGHVSTRVIVYATHGSFWRHDSDDRQLCAANSNILTNGIACSKKLCSKTGAEHNHLLFLVYCLLGKIRTTSDIHRADSRKVDCGTEDADIGQRDAIRFDRFTGVLFDCYANDARNLLGNGISIVEYQAAAIIRRKAITSTSAEIRCDENQVRSQARYLIVNRRFGAGADRYYADHRSNADDDAEHGKHGADLIFRNRFP